MNGIALLPSLMNGLEEFGRISTWVFQGMGTVTHFAGDFFNKVAVTLGGGSYATGVICAEGDMIATDAEEQSQAPSLLQNGGSGQQAAPQAMGGIYYTYRRVEEIYLYTATPPKETKVFLYVADTESPDSDVNKMNPIVTWIPTRKSSESGSNPNNLIMTKTQDSTSGLRGVSIKITGLCDVDLEAKVGTRSFGHVRVVSANKIDPPYAAVAKYTGTYAYQGPLATSGDAKRFLLDAREATPTEPARPSAPNLEVIGEHGNFYLVKIRKTDWIWPGIWGTQAMRFVEKTKSGKTGVDAQNISKVVYPSLDRPDLPNTSQPLNGDFWGYRKKVARFHQGPDIGTQGDTTLNAIAIMDGKVISVINHSVRGWTVVLEHNIAGLGKFYTVYQHLQSSGLATVDTMIKAGDTNNIVGKIGNTGDPGDGSGYDYHLHYELMKTPPVNLSKTYIGTSSHSINPLMLYCSTDKRDTRIANNPTYNPQPFFHANSENNYVFNAKFDWKYSEANMTWRYKNNSTNPNALDDLVKGRYSHDISYQR